MMRWLLIALLLCGCNGISSEYGSVSDYEIAQDEDRDWSELPTCVLGWELNKGYGDSIRYMLAITNVPLLIETIADTTFSPPHEHWTDVHGNEVPYIANTYYYLKLKINNEVYRIQLIKEEQ